MGIGQSGVLPIYQETKSWLEPIINNKDLQLIEDRTTMLLDNVNNLIREGKKIAGIFHTTC